MAAIIKKLKIILFLLGLSLMINPLGFCFDGYDQRGRSIGNGESDKGAYMEADQTVRKEVPFSPLTAEASFISQARISEGTKETVTGLKSVGFNTEDIVKTLKNGNKNAIEISIACLNVNISGEEIYNALINAGFSQPTADEAVPQALRNDKQLYNGNPGQKADVNVSGLNNTALGLSDPGQKTETSMSFLMTNDALLENTVDALKQANVSTPQVINVLKGVGVSAEKIIEVLGKDLEKGPSAVFKGLGEWASFQNNRFGESEQVSARKVELINSMLASGFSVEEIVKGFMDSGEGKANVQKGKNTRVIIADLANAGVKFEEIIGVLKGLGFSAQAICDALTGKSVSLIDKVKSGMLFSGEKHDIAVKVINNLTQGDTLNSSAQKLQEEGYKPAVIADTLKFLGVSSKQIAEVLKGQNINLR